VGGKADPALQRRQSQLGSQPRRQPWIGRRQRRPDPFVEAAEHHEIGTLQPRLEQAPDEDARMLTVRRPHGHARHQSLEHHRELGRTQRLGPFRRGGLEAGEQLRRGPPRRAGPDFVAGQSGGTGAQRREQPGQARWPAEGRFKRPQQRLGVLPPSRRTDA
jgi:hypothetical protein